MSNREETRNQKSMRISRRDFMRAAATVAAFGVVPKHARAKPLNNRFNIPGSGVVQTGSALFQSDSAQIPVEPPNVIVIFADDLGYRDIGAYGNVRIPTPNIDRIAANGVRFTDGYVTAATCSPSRAGLMSGQYQQRHGFEFNTGSKDSHEDMRGLDPAVTTLADRMKAQGYETWMVGKWHLGEDDPRYFPLQRGFDYFYGILAGAHTYMPYGSQGQPLSKYELTEGNEPAPPNEDYLTDVFADKAVQLIQNRPADRPFFLYLPFNAVHVPLEATGDYLDRFTHIPDKDSQIYAAMISSFDDAVGRIMDTLTAEGIDRNTLVFFASDNGGLLSAFADNSPLRFGKGLLFEGGIRIPFMMQWKGVIPAGAVSPVPVSTLDIAATALSASGGAPPDSDLDGMDLLPVATGAAKVIPREFLFWRNGPNRAVRNGSWKLLQAGENVWLFNLASDIGEKHNLAEERCDIRDRLMEALDKWDETLIPPLWPSRPEMRRTMIIDGFAYDVHI